MLFSFVCKRISFYIIIMLHRHLHLPLTKRNSIDNQHLINDIWNSSIAIWCDVSVERRNARYVSSARNGNEMSSWNVWAEEEQRTNEYHKYACNPLVVSRYSQPQHTTPQHQKKTKWEETKKYDGNMHKHRNMMKIDSRTMRWWFRLEFGWTDGTGQKAQ